MKILHSGCLKDGRRFCQDKKLYVPKGTYFFCLLRAVYRQSEQYYTRCAMSMNEDVIYRFDKIKILIKYAHISFVLIIFMLIYNSITTEVK